MPTKATTIRACATLAATGISLSGLYYYFRSKDELLFPIQDHCFGVVLESARQLLAAEADPQMRLRLLVENHLRFFAIT